MMLPAQFATGTTGVLASKIGWIDFGPELALYPYDSPIHVANSLPGGYTVAFDIALINHGETDAPFLSVVPPAYERTPFGQTGYTGITGHVVLYSDHPPWGEANETIQLGNIVVTNAQNVPIIGYRIVAADAETTDGVETLAFHTNGSAWTLLDNLPATNGTAFSPKIYNVGTADVLEQGVVRDPAITSGPVFSTYAPTEVDAHFSFTQHTQQGIAVGVYLVDPNQAVNDLLESVALEQAALSHVLNAEGEKLQAVIAGGSVEEMLAANASAKKLVNAVAGLEMVLRSKLRLFSCRSCG